MEILEQLTSSGALTKEKASEVESLVAKDSISYEEALLKSGLSQEVVRDAYAKYYGVEPMVLTDDTEITQKILKINWKN